MVNDAKNIIEFLFEDPFKALLTLLVLIFVYLYVAKRKDNSALKEKLQAEKQIFYINLLTFLNKIIRQKVNLEEESTMIQLVELDSQLKLYSNDNVVLAWADFWHSLYYMNSSNETLMHTFKAYGILQLNIRKDLRSSNAFTQLKWYDFSRSYINDLDNYLSEEEKQFRTTDMKAVVKTQIVRK